MSLNGAIETLLKVSWLHTINEDYNWSWRTAEKIFSNDNAKNIPPNPPRRSQSITFPYSSKEFHSSAYHCDAKRRIQTIWYFNLLKTFECSLLTMLLLHDKRRKIFSHAPGVCLPSLIPAGDSSCRLSAVANSFPWFIFCWNVQASDKVPVFTFY